MTEPGSRPRPGGRSARVRRAVLDATLDLLHLHGMDGLTVAEVSTRAGVHETSIYRRWGTRENLMIDALLEEAEELLPIPDTGSLRDDLIAYLTSLAAYLSTPQGNAFDRALAAAGDDPAASQARKQYWDTRHTRSGEIITRGIDRGELPAPPIPALRWKCLSHRCISRSYSAANRSTRAYRRDWSTHSSVESWRTRTRADATPTADRAGRRLRSSRVSRFSACAY